MAGEAKRKIFVCSCEGTIPLATGEIGKGCTGAAITTAKQLCRAEISRFIAAGRDGELTVACTQEAPHFEAVAEDNDLPATLTFVNIREAAGWSTEGAKAGPKMAALLAGAAVPATEPAMVTLESEGVALLYGRGQAAIDAAMKLKDRLDVTVILADADGAVPPRRMELPVRKGRIAAVSGHLGAFEIRIDGFAEPAPSSRASFVFGPERDGAISKADILIDLSGGPSLVPAGDLRPGYVKADPASPTDLADALARAADLDGTFDKPRYITFTADLCVHSRSRKTGCRRCLDLCPTGAITPAGDHVAIDPNICAGCGQCAAACPTGAAAYAMPAAPDLTKRLRAMLTAYRQAGGRDAQLLIHDEDHGADMIDMAARLGDGLPARTIPVAVNEVTQVGLEVMTAAFAYGAAEIRVLTRAKPKHDIAGLSRTIETVDRLVAGLGYGAGLVSTLETDDPDEMVARLKAPSGGKAAAKPSAFVPAGSKRDALKLSLREMHRAAPAPVDVIALPEGAVLGGLNIRTDGCTLCLSCVSACPTQALGDAQDRPLLKFDESLCVQCGLCRSTCPEQVISLVPRVDFRAFEAGAVVVKEEEPFHCIACDKAFGVKSTIERVAAKLQDKHWMFTGANKGRVDLIRMCDDCRVSAVTNAGIDPYAGPARPPVRTSEDYFKEREAAAQREAEMLKKIESGEA